MYSAKVYVPAAYPRELWLAVFDPQDRQVLHLAFTPHGTLYAHSGAYGSGKPILHRVPQANWEEAVTRVLDETVR